MTTKFKVDDRVRWNSEAGHVSGRIIKVLTRDTDYKGYTHHASKDDPISGSLPLGIETDTEFLRRQTQARLSPMARACSRRTLTKHITLRGVKP